MRIDLLTIADLPAALRLSTLAGWNQVEQDWRRLVELWPDSCFAGRVDGQLVATATLATYGRQLAWVGMVLVDPDHRHRGFATAMMRHVLDHAERIGIPVLGLDASDEARPLYVKLGFHDASQVYRLRREPAPTPARPVGPATTGDADGATVGELDRVEMGFDRSPLLDHLGREPGVRVFAAATGGYCVRRTGRTAWHLGPLIAPTPKAFNNLLLAALRDGEPVIADAADPRVLPLLEARGFRVTRTLTRMYRPASIVPYARHLQLAAAFELG